MQGNPWTAVAAGALALATAGLVACGGGNAANPVAPTINTGTTTNRPPTITYAGIPGWVQLEPGQRVPARVDATDPDNDTFSCRWEATSGAWSNNSACSTDYVAPMSPTTDAIKVTVTDSRGAGASAQWTMKIDSPAIAAGGGTSPTPPPTSGGNPNPEPTPTPGPAPTPAPTPTPTSSPAPSNNPPTVTLTATAGSCHPTPSKACSVAVTATANDPDGNPISFSWSGCCQGSGAGSSCTVSNISSHTCQVIVSDGRGGSASDSVSVEGVNANPTVYTDRYMTAPGPGKNVTIQALVNDPDGDSLSCANVIPSPECAPVTTNTCTKIVCAVRNSPGPWSFPVTFVARDEWGGSGESTIEVRVD